MRASEDKKQLPATVAAADERSDVNSMRSVLLALSETADTAERIALTDRDADRVSDLLENPPKPSPALQAAARRRAARL